MIEREGLAQTRTKEKPKGLREKDRAKGGL